PGEQCIIIDPGYGIGPELDEIISANRLHPVAVLLTHGHLDHTFSVLPVCQARDVPAYIHGSDRAMIADPWTSMGMAYGSPIFGVSGLTFAEPDDVRLLEDGSDLVLAAMTLRVEHSPGHTRGSVVFCADAEQTADAPLMFSGDLLFAGSIGRMDLPGGSEAEMGESLQRVVRPKPDEMVVHTGHGPSTTIGRERLTNPYLREYAR
ncbi:MAG: fold metallo-hydrolase, partial [Pseudonocardiales bacterium]|nr:fold metallo-hydrolase [Pseudonocardiales bacterium]